MGILTNIKWGLHKLTAFYKKAQICRKHGYETKYHFDNPDFKIGSFTYGIPEIRIYDKGKLEIGKYCSISDGVKIMIGGAHHSEWASSYPFYYMHRDVFTNTDGQHPPTTENTVIGNDVWIGNGVTILSGKKIGNGAIIGAGAVVSKDIPPYAIAVGNPIRIIRFRFNQETISKLEDTEWWNLPEDKINSLLPYIADITKFIKHANLLKKTTT